MTNREPLTALVTTADDVARYRRNLQDEIDSAAIYEAMAGRETNPGLAEIYRKLGAVEEDIYQVRNRSNQDPLNFPIKLNNQIAALARSIETGDAPPTDQAYVVFRELTAQLDAIHARLDELLKTQTQ